MSPLKASRVGSPLRIRGEELAFSYWPMTRSTRRWGLHSMVYASDPWSTIESGLSSQCADSDLPTAVSFVRQSREYARAADTAVSYEAKPTLYYYSFLNLVKALGLARRTPGLVGRVSHGLTHLYQAGEEVQVATLRAFPSGAEVNAFDRFLEILTGRSLPAETELPVMQLMSQSVVGHRMWLEASNRKERFIGIDSIRLLHDDAARLVWTTLEIDAESLSRRALWPRKVAVDSDLHPDWTPVEDRVGPGGQILRRFEQVVPVTYRHRASDNVMDLVSHLRPRLWRVARTVEPFRKYYLYMAPPGELRLPQPAAVYALMFYLGSVARYRPASFLATLQGRYGGFVREFITTQPRQFIYELACEARKQEVAKASVV